VSLSLDDDVLLDEEEVTRRLLEVFGNPAYSPPTLPSVATELMALSQQADVSFDAVVELLESDAMLTGRMLRIAQSALYSGATAITSVRDAVLRFGLNTLRDIVLETCMNLRVFRADAYTDTMERLRLHSSFTGHVARIVCKHTAIEQEYAFLCGLLHDVGVAGSLIALSEGAGKKKRPDLASIWPAIDRAHAQAAGLMAKVWQLPPDVQLAIANHHQVRVDGQPHPLSATLCIADEIAHQLDVGLVAPQGAAIEGESELEAACLQSHTATDRSGPKTLALACETLAIGDRELASIRDDAEQLRGELR